MFDAGDGSRGEKTEHRAPIIGRLIAQQQADFAARSGGDIGPARPPQRARRTAEQRLKRLVEPADAAEA
jgi:hypothetical protein